MDVMESGEEGFLVMRQSYPAVFTQLIAPEYNDDEKRYFIQKEMEIPFIPTEKMGYILPDLGRYVLQVQWVHYDFNDGKFYIGLLANWVQVWDDNEYLFEETRVKMNNYLEVVRRAGWTVTEKPWGNE